MGMKSKVLKKKQPRGDGDYVEKDEKYDKKMLNKDLQMKKKPSGIANQLARSEKEMGYAKVPKVKPTKKV